MNKTCTIRAVAIYTYLQRSTCQFMMLNMKPYVTHTLEFLLQQIWVNKVHLRKVWNWKGNPDRPYKLLIRKDHWRLIKYFIPKIIEKPGHGHMR